MSSSRRTASPASSPTTATLAPRVAGLGTAGVGQEELGGLSVADLVTQRSMLTIVIAACTSARAVFEDADDVIDPHFRADLDRMIERSTSELEKLNVAIGQATRRLSDLGFE
jgi:hypothetical protein